MKRRKKKSRRKKTKRKTSKLSKRELEVVVALSCLLLLFIYFLDFTITSHIVTSVPHSCEDSDGKNFYREGKVELYIAIGRPILENTYIDYCSDKDTLTEYYCEWENSNHVVKIQEINCDCSMGACTKAHVPKSNILDKIFEFFGI